MPLVINADFSIPVSEKFHIGLGTNIGVVSWADLSLGQIFVPNASFTFGSRENNFNISVGYLGLSFEDKSSGKITVFLGGQRQINQKLCFVIESAVLSFDNKVYGIVIPALRFYTSGNNAWQFGFAALFGGDDISGIPFPSVQYMWNM